MKITIRKSIYNNSKMMILFLVVGMVSPWVMAFDYPEAGDFANGSKAWSENCARCHNMRNPSDLRDDQWVTTVFHMRARAGLTGQESRDILTFLQGSNAKVKKERQIIAKPLAVSMPATQSGKSIYEKNCVACHGVNGKGSLPGVPDFTAKSGRLLKSDRELLSNIINGFQSPGSSMPMPPKGGNSSLAEGDIQAVVTYIRAAFGRKGVE